MRKPKSVEAVLEILDHFHTSCTQLTESLAVMENTFLEFGQFRHATIARLIDVGLIRKTVAALTEFIAYREQAPEIFSHLFDIDELETVRDSLDTICELVESALAPSDDAKAGEQP